MVRRLLVGAAICCGAHASTPSNQAVLSPPSETLRLQYDGPVHILVSSVGGVGTTTMLEELSYVRDYYGQPLKVNKLDDKDGLKHTPFRRLQSEHGDQLWSVEKILYLWGNPRHAVESLYKRGYATTQAEKLHQYAIQDKIGFENRFPKSIWGYAKRTKEVFEFEQHYDGFRSQKQFTIAFLHMEAKTNSLVDLGLFLGCNVTELTYHLSPWQESAAFELTTLNELAMMFPNTTITEAMLANHTRARVAQSKLAKRRALHEEANAAAKEAAQGASKEYMPASAASSSAAVKLLAASGDEDDYQLSQEIQQDIDSKFASLNRKTAQIGDWNLIMNEGPGSRVWNRRHRDQNNDANRDESKRDDDGQRAGASRRGDTGDHQQANASAA